MRIRKYVVDTMPEALIRIRKDLGSDAVILDQKKIKVGGFLGLFRKEKLEVTAVVEPSNIRKNNNNTRTDSNNLRTNNSQTAYSDTKKVQTENNAQASKPASTNELPTKDANVKKDIVENKENSAVEHKEKKLNNNVIDELNHSNNTVASSNLDMINEFKQLKDMFVKMMIQNEKEDLTFSGKAIYNQLIKNEIDTELASKLVTKVLQNVGPTTPISENHLFDLIRQEIEKIFDKHKRKVTKTHKQVVLAFVGPTGVGKTTTIAKLAAYYALEKKQKVGFITSDTYRIAAVEQLKMYANILNIPIEIVINLEYMHTALNNLQTCDVVLIDTAGRNFMHEVHCDELSKLLNIAKPDEVFLVLSMTTKQKDIINITESLNKINFNSFIFTKLDETSTYGSILNIVDKYEKPIAFLTNGQNVPEDLMFVESHKIAEMIVGVTDE